MKKFFIAVLFIATTLFLVACNDDEEVTEPLPGDGDTSGEVSDENDTDTTGEEGTADNDTTEGSDNNSDVNDRYNFVEFSLEVDVDQDEDVIDVEFETDADGTEAKYVDKSQDIDLTGDEAMDKLDSIFTTFNFDDVSSDDEIIREITEAFNIPENASNIDIDVEFQNGSERDIER
ncbi:YusW family protein [Oceanobacillus sp. CAU 1775]